MGECRLLPSLVKPYMATPPQTQKLQVNAPTFIYCLLIVSTNPAQEETPICTALSGVASVWETYLRSYIPSGFLQMQDILVRTRLSVTALDICQVRTTGKMVFGRERRLGWTAQKFLTTSSLSAKLCFTQGLLLIAPISYCEARSAPR